MNWWYELTWNWHTWRMRRAVRALATHRNILRRAFPEMKKDPMEVVARQLEGVPYQRDD